jgi:transcriptional regulator with XRE-family HTH domain
MKFNITKIRTKKGMSLSELARRSGVAKSALFYIEIGGTPNPRFDTLCKIAKALNVRVAELFLSDTGLWEP